MLDIPNIGFGSYQEGERIGPTLWNRHDMIFVIHGTGSLKSGARTFDVKEGNVMVIPPMQAFEGYVKSKNATICVMHVKRDKSSHGISGLMSKQRAFIVPNVILDPFYRQCIKKMQELYETKNDPQWEAVANHLGMVLLMHVDKMSKKRELSRDALKPFDEILVWAKNNVALGIQTRTLAEKANLSESRFRTRFRNFYETSPSKVLKDFRLQEAKRLLQNPQYSIKEISHLAGYSDVVSFYHAFQSLGVTPAKYRSSLRKDI